MELLNKCVSTQSRIIDEISKLTLKLDQLEKKIDEEKQETQREFLKRDCDLYFTPVFGPSRDLQDRVLAAAMEIRNTSSINLDPSAPE